MLLQIKYFPNTIIVNLDPRGRIFSALINAFIDRQINVLSAAWNKSLLTKIPG